MRRRYLLLLAIGFALSWFHGESLSRESSSESAPDSKISQRPEGKVAGDGPKVQPRGAPERPYTALVEKNIFSPERKEFPIPLPPTVGPVKKPLTRPQVILYGVTLAGEYQSATVMHPGRALRKGEREMLTLKLGERIGEYRLTKILPDRIALEAEEDSFEVLLDDASRPKARTAVRTETRPAAVTSAISGPTSGEPPRPGALATPAPETPRPGIPTPAPSSERVTSPPMPAPSTPAAISPTPLPTPQPTVPTPPTYAPRRRVPIPSTPSPENAPRQPGTGGPGGP